MTGKSKIHVYNKPFTEIKVAIKQQKNTALGEDTIHPQMIKMLPPKAKHFWKCITGS